jgi:glycosyltransferase involved in cell wall biosynthesis
MWRCARSLVRRGDILIAKTDPPFTSVFAARIAQQANAQLVNWLQDIYPETAAELGVPFMRGSVGRCLGYLRDQSLRRAQANVVVGRLMAERVKSRGVSHERVHVIPNWTDDEKLCPVVHADNPLRREWGLEGSFVVGYSGNLGRAHEFGTVLTGAERLRGHPRIVFLFTGGGHHFDQLTQAVRERGLQQMFRFIPYQPHDLLKIFPLRAGCASGLASTRARRIDCAEQILWHCRSGPADHLGDFTGGRNSRPCAPTCLRTGGGAGRWSVPR